MADEENSASGWSRVRISATTKFFISESPSQLHYQQIVSSIFVLQIRQLRYKNHNLAKGPGLDHSNLNVSRDSDILYYLK